MLVGIAPIASMHDLLLCVGDPAAVPWEALGTLARHCILMTELRRLGTICP